MASHLSKYYLQLAAVWDRLNSSRRYHLLRDWRQVRTFLRSVSNEPLL